MKDFLNAFVKYFGALAILFSVLAGLLLSIRYYPVAGFILLITVLSAVLASLHYDE